MDNSPIPHAVRTLWGILHQAAPTYLVGGAVRDLAGGIRPHDWDLATRLTPRAATAHARSHGYRVVPTGEAFGTVSVLTTDGPVEVTTFRREGRYADGRHPQRVVFAESIEEDLSRRDFTMNAMAIHWDGTLIDPLGGWNDLKRGVIVTVGDADARFKEDPLRMLRALRFSATDYQGRPMMLDAEALRSIKRHKALVISVSGERQRVEFWQLLTAPHFAAALETLSATGLLGIVWPEWVAAQGFVQHNPHHAYPVDEHLLRTAAQGSDPMMRLTGLLHDIAKPSCLWRDDEGVGHFYDHDRLGAIMAQRMMQRMAFDRDTIHHVCALIARHMFPWDTAGDKAIRRMLREEGAERVQSLLALRRMDVIGAGSQWSNEDMVRQRVQRIVDSQPLGPPRLALSGRDIMEIAGIGPGPAVGQHLRRLQEWVDDNPDRNTGTRLKAYLLENLSKLPDPD